MENRRDWSNVIYKPQTAKDCQQLPEARRGTSPSEPPEGTNPANFQPAGQSENTFLFFMAAIVW